VVQLNPAEMNLRFDREHKHEMLNPIGRETI